MSDEKDKKPMMFRPQSDIVGTIDYLTPIMKELKLIDSNASRNQIVEYILNESIYNEDAKIFNYKGQKKSLLDIKKTRDAIELKTKIYSDRLIEDFTKDNHLMENGELNLSGPACYFAFNSNDGVIIEGRDSNGKKGNYINYPVLKQILITNIQLNSVSIPVNLQSLVLNLALQEMCQYFCEDGNIFNRIESNKNIENKDRFFKFEKYKLKPSMLNEIESVDIVVYRASEDAPINYIDFTVNMLNGKHGRSEDIDMEFDDEVEVIKYVSSQLGFDVTTIKYNLEDEIEN